MPFFDASVHPINAVSFHLMFFFYFLVTMAQSLRCKVEEHLACSICLKQLKDPKVLPCLHSYCRDCIVDLAEHAKSNKFNCPNCRLEVKVNI